MSFFLLLSEDPADYEDDSFLEECDSFQISHSDDMDNYLELTLDTGEMFSVPLDWLICACRKNNFSSDCDYYAGNIH